MWRVVVALACLVLLFGPARAELLTARQFTEGAAQALKAVAPKYTVDVTGDLKLNVRRENGSTLSVDLINLYAAYRLEPDRYDQILQRIVASVAEIPMPASAPAKVTPASNSRVASAAPTADAKINSNIVPTIKSRAWLDELKAQLAPSKQEPVFEDYNKELVIVYAEDNSNKIRYLTSGEKIGVEPDKLREFAVANLKRVLPDIKLSALEEGRIYLIDANGDYNASLLLLDKIWADDRLKVDGDIVIAMPVRDMLVVTGSKDRKALKVVRSMVKKWFAEGPYSLTESLFVYRGGKFAKFGR